MPKEPVKGVKALTELSVSQVKSNNLGTIKKSGNPRQYVNIYDKKVNGLILRVNSGGAKVWHVRYYAKTVNKNGKQGSFVRTRRLGRYPVLKVNDARDKALQFLGDPDKALTQSDAKSFQEVAENYIKRYVDGNPHAKPPRPALRSKGEIVRCLNKYVLPRWGDRKFIDLKRADVAELLDEIEDNHGAVQADQVLAIISSICTWYQSRDNDYVSPIVKRMRRTKQKDRARTRILGDDPRYGDGEISALWNAVSECGPFGAMVKMLLLTGQRLRKVAKMQWSDISVDGVWTIRTEPREKGNPGSLRLPQLARDIIAAQPRIAGTPYVFVGARGGPIAAFNDGKRDLDHRLRDTLPDMRPWVLHDLRRTARSLLSRRECGVLPHIAEQVLGHAIPGVAAIYDRHRYDDDKADALNKLANLIDHIVNPPKGNVVAIADAARKKRKRR
jgi:integrase